MRRRSVLSLLTLVVSPWMATGAQASAVAKLVVWKSERRMATLDAAGNTLNTYRIALGFAPMGHKTQEGDGKTPEGTYRISGRNPDSAFHRSLKISYPNGAYKAQAKARGVSPGGDIFIHGQPNGYGNGTIRNDWTLGCIAVSNAEIEALWTAVSDGTPIEIRP